MNPDPRTPLRTPVEDGITAPFEPRAVVSPDVCFPTISPVPRRSLVPRNGANIGVGQLRRLLIGHDPVEPTRSRRAQREQHPSTVPDMPSRSALMGAARLQSWTTTGSQTVHRS